MVPIRSQLKDPLFAVRACVIAALVLAPSLFDLGTVKPFDVVKTTTVMFFGWLAAGFWLAQVIRGKARPRRFTMAYFAAAFLLVSALGTLLSTTKLTSLFGWYGRYDGLVTLIVLVLYFYVVACVYREPGRNVAELVWAMAAGALILTFYIWIQRLGLDPIRWAQPGGDSISRPNFGTMGNSNFAGGYLGLTSPWIYLALVRFGGWKRIAVAVAGVAQLYALWITSARNGFIAVGAAALALLIVHRKRVPMILKLGAAAAAIAALLIAVLVIWHPGSDEPPAALQRVGVLRSDTIRVRGYWWLAGVKMFAERPIIGWGPESYVTHFASYLPRESAPVANIETADEPHNVFVRHLANTGVLGFAAYVGLLVLAFRRLFRRLRTAGADQPVVVTFIALLAAYIGQAFFSIDVTAIALVSWVSLGAIAALADPPDPDAPRSAPRPRPVALAAVVLVVALLLAGLSTAPLKADHEARTARRLANADRSQSEILDHYSKAMSLAPYEPIYRGFAGDYLERQAGRENDRDVRRQLLTDALAYHREMDELQPGYAQWKLSVAKATASLATVDGATFEEAEQLFDEALRLAPYDFRIVVGQAELYNLWAQFGEDRDEAPALLCRGLDRAREAARLNPNRTSPSLAIGKTLARLGHLKQSKDPLQRAASNDATKALAERILKEVRRLEKEPKSKRPPVVDCGEV